MKGERGRTYQGLIRRTEEAMFNSTDSDSESWSLLANAIILRAVDDYKKGRLCYMDLHRFLHSDWFLLLSRGCVSPASILTEVKKNGETENESHRASPKTFL